MKKILIVILSFITSASVYASEKITDQIASSDAVKKLVQGIAAQSMSGDPIYCNFEADKIKVVSVIAKLNTLEYQVQFFCGGGQSVEDHATDIEIYVKGTIEDSEVFVKALQVGKKLN